MKKLFIILAFLTVSLRVSTQDDVQQQSIQMQKDSLRKALTLNEGKDKLITYFRLTNLYYPEAFDALKRDTLLALYDEWDAEEERQGSKRGSSIRTNKLFMFQMVGMYDEVIKRAPEYLEFMEKQEQYVAYYQAYQTLVRAYGKKGDNDAALREAQNMYEHAMKLHLNEGVGTAFYAMSEIYGSQRRYDEQEKCLKDCIALFQGLSRYEGLLANAYVNLCGVYIAQKRYEDALSTAGELEEFLPRYEENLHAAQPNAWRNLWLVYQAAYRNLGDYNKAEIYINKADSIGGDEKSVLFAARAHILMGSKRYAEALEMANKGIAEYPLQERDELREIKIEILMRMGDFDGAIRQLNEYIAERDAIRDTEANAKLDEIRTRYEVHLLEKEKNKAMFEKQRNRNYFLFALGGCFLLAITLGIWMYYSRTIVRKNLTLYRQIKEQDRITEELEKAKAQHQLLPENEKESEQQDFIKRLREHVLSDRYSANPEADIDKLIAALNSNRSYLYKTVKQMTGQTVQDCVNTIRLDEARRLLDTTDELIEAVAWSSGFNSARTFYRVFRDRYNMTPSDYRKSKS